MKITAKQVKIFVLILIASILFGILYDAIATGRDRKTYPRVSSYASFVKEASEETGVPEEMLWALGKAESNFSPDAVGKNGEIGILQLSPSVSEFICNKLLEVSYDSRVLYDPKTNFLYGATYLAYLADRYGYENRDQIFAAYRVGTEQVDAWLADPEHLASDGSLKKLPRDVSSYIDKLEKITDYYQKLYY